tara:strand:- start:558 stop:1136 length:579 start_codon:yes stop_codon:yes gene_type:complete
VEESSGIPDRVERTMGAGVADCPHLPRDIVSTIVRCMPVRACFGLRSVSREWMVATNREIHDRAGRLLVRPGCGAVRICLSDFTELADAFRERFQASMGVSDPGAYGECLRVLHVIDSFASPHVSSTTGAEPYHNVLRVRAESRFERHDSRVRLEGINLVTGRWETTWLHACARVASSTARLKMLSTSACLL